MDLPTFSRMLSSYRRMRTRWLISLPRQKHPAPAPKRKKKCISKLKLVSNDPAPIVAVVDVVEDAVVTVVTVEIAEIVADEAVVEAVGEAIAVVSVSDGAKVIEQAQVVEGGV